MPDPSIDPMFVPNWYADNLADEYYGTSERSESHASDLPAASLRKIIDNWNMYSKNMQNILIAKYGISPGGFIPEDKLGTFDEKRATNMIVPPDNDPWENEPNPTDHSSGNTDVGSSSNQAREDLTAFLEALTTGQPSPADNSTVSAATIVPEPRDSANIKLDPVELLAYKTKSKRLWSLRKLDLDQLIEIYQHLYDTMFNAVSRQRNLSERTENGIRKNLQRPSRRFKIQRYSQSRSRS